MTEFFVQSLDWFVVPLIFAIWVFWDASRRGNDKASWTLGSFFLTVFVVPNYLAKRNLKKGETRKGGVWWQRLKYFAAMWILYCLSKTFLSDFSKFSLLGDVEADAFGLYSLSLIYGIPVILALLIGFYVRDPSEIEEGPTGPLTESEKDTIGVPEAIL